MNRLFLSAFAALPVSAGSHAQLDRPNFLMIMADDVEISNVSAYSRGSPLTRLSFSV